MPDPMLEAIRVANQQALWGGVFGMTTAANLYAQVLLQLVGEGCDGMVYPKDDQLADIARFSLRAVQIFLKQAHEQEREGRR